MIDWKSFDDGSMPQAERDRVHADMLADPNLRQQYDSYQAYITTLRDQVLRQPMPHLQVRFARPPVIRRPFLISGAVVAVAAIVMLGGPLFNRDTPVAVLRPDRFATSPELGRLATDRPVEASTWLVRRTGMDAPAIEDRERVRLSAAAYGRDWAGYDFKCAEGSLKLRFAYQDPFATCSKVTLDGGIFFEADGLGWRQGGLSYLLTGSEGVPLKQYASVIYRAIGKSRKLSVAPVKGPL